MGGRLGRIKGVEEKGRLGWKVVEFILKGGRGMEAPRRSRRAARSAEKGERR